jgi:hypothetical protein
MRQPLQSDFDDLDIRLIVGQQEEWKPCEIASSDTTSRFVVGSRLAGPLRLSAGPWPLLERRREAWFRGHFGVQQVPPLIPPLIRVFSALETDSPGLVQFTVHPIRTPTPYRHQHSDRISAGTKSGTARTQCHRLLAKRRKPSGDGC